MRFATQDHRNGREIRQGTEQSDVVTERDVYLQRPERPDGDLAACVFSGFCAKASPTVHSQYAQGGKVFEQAQGEEIRSVTAELQLTHRSERCNDICRKGYVFENEIV